MDASFDNCSFMRDQNEFGRNPSPNLGMGIPWRPPSIIVHSCIMKISLKILSLTLIAIMRLNYE
jgi:hypothetical protein